MMEVIFLIWKKTWNVIEYATITWNTNRINIDGRYDINGIRYINLHRNDADDKKNQELKKFGIGYLYPK